MTETSGDDILFHEDEIKFLILEMERLGIMEKEIFESIVKTLKSDLVEVTKPDAEAVAALVDEIKGDRTLKEYAEASGVSSPTLSRIMNGKITRPLTIETIVYLVSASEKNTLGTMHRLARSCGYMSRSEQSALRGKIQLRQTRNGMFAAVKKEMLAVIVTEMFQRGTVNDSRLLDSESGTLFTVNELALKYDFAFDVDEEGQKSSWHFFCFPQRTEDYKTEPVSADALARNMMKELSPLFLTDAWLPSQHADKKISFCFVDAGVFEEFCNLMEYSKFNNRFSAILIDEDANKVIEERCFKTNNGIGQNSLFNLPLKIAINFDDDTVVDEIGENSFVIISDELDGGADD